MVPPLNACTVGGYTGNLCSLLRRCSQVTKPGILRSRSAFQWALWAVSSAVSSYKVSRSLCVVCTVWHESILGSMYRNNILHMLSMHVIACDA